MSPHSKDSQRENVDNPARWDPNGATRRRLAARIGGIALHLRHDSKLIAARARAGLLAKFERMADPEGVLDQEARLKRAKLLMRQHMSRLALKSVRSRARPTRRKS